jgi:hypothetical protein
MPEPPARFARLLPDGIKLTRGQLAELRTIGQLADKDIGAAVPAWNAFLARHSIDPPSPPPPNTAADTTDRLTALREECRQAALLAQRVSRAGLRADWHGIVRRLYDRAMEAAPTGHVPPVCPAEIEDEVVGREAIARLMEWLAAVERMNAGHAPPVASPPASPARPDQPTAGYCASERYVVRWQGQVEVRPALWQLLTAVLAAQDRAVSFRELMTTVYHKARGGKSEASLRNDVSELNGRLAEVNFPWTLGVKQGREGKEVRVVADRTDITK